MTLPEEIRTRYVEVNGDHPMADADVEYCRRFYVPLAGDAEYSLADVHRLVLDRRLPLPSYLLPDGTAMVHPGHLDLLNAAGGPDRVEAWFTAHWPAGQQAVAAEEWGEYLSGQYTCLYRVTPETIQAKTRLIEQIRGLVERLEADADAGTREELRGAVDELDALEPPFTGYDRLRFGTPLSRDVWIDDVRATHLAPVEDAGRAHAGT